MTKAASTQCGEQTEGGRGKTVLCRHGHSNKPRFDVKSRRDRTEALRLVRISHKAVQKPLTDKPTLSYVPRTGGARAMLVGYGFTIPATVAHCELRPLRDPGAMGVDDTLPEIP